MYCDQSLNPKVVTDPAPTRPLEAISVKILIPNGNSMIVCCVYQLHKSNAARLKAFAAYVSQIFILCPRIIVLGDFNEDLLKSTDFSSELVLNFGLDQHIKTATRVTLTMATLTDHIYSTNIDVTHAGTINLHIADHYAVYYAIKSSSAIGTAASDQHFINQFRSFKQLNVAALQEDMHELSKSLSSSTSTVNALAADFSSRYCNIWDQHAPLKSCRIRRKRTPWMTTEVLHSLHIRYALY